MKSLIFALLVFVSAVSFSQQAPGQAPDVQVEVTPLFGYQMGASVNTIDGKLRYKPGASYQLGLSFDVIDVTEIELSYNFSKSYLTFDNWYSNPDWLTGNRIDANYHFYQLNIIKGIRYGAIKPYGLISLGAAHMVFTDKSQFDGNGSDVWRFAFNLGLGAKIFVTERIGLRIQGKINAPVSGVGFGVGCGGGGCGSGVSTTSFFVQGEVQGGLVVVLKPADAYATKGNSMPTNTSSLW